MSAMNRRIMKRRFGLSALCADCVCESGEALQCSWTLSPCSWATLQILLISRACGSEGSVDPLLHQHRTQSYSCNVFIMCLYLD